jgi:hypothetical protein
VGNNFFRLVIDSKCQRIGDELIVSDRNEQNAFGFLDSESEEKGNGENFVDR